MSTTAGPSVGVLGANGRMGTLAARAIAACDDLRLGGLVGRDESWAAVEGDDVLIDFTTPESVLSNLATGLEHGKHVVVGASGLTADAMGTIESWCSSHPGLGVHIVPNFSIAATLAQAFGAQASRSIPHSEIIEFAGPHKLDAPSGTANALAEEIARADFVATAGDPVRPARGDHSTGVPIHSVRLPGLLSAQIAYLCTEHEQLSIGFETRSREAFVPGILLALRNITMRPGLRIGLADLLVPRRS